jgi:hypothetical protein
MFQSCTKVTGRELGGLTLSPKPHIRARMGCCSTCSLIERVSLFSVIAAKKSSNVPVHSAAFVALKRFEVAIDATVDLLDLLDLLSLGGRQGGHVLMVHG